MRYLIALIFLFTSSLAFAQQRRMMCMPQKIIVDTLQRKYEETRRAVGMVTPKVVLELFLSDKGSWSIVFTETNGKSCLFATGKDWIEVTPKKGKSF